MTPEKETRIALIAIAVLSVLAILTVILDFAL